MSDRQTYPLTRWGNLLLLRASIKQHQEFRIIQLLVDTGSSFTVLPRRVLFGIGCDFSQPSQSVTIIAAGGLIQAPKVVVSQFNCLGCVLKNVSVVALDFPTRSPAAGRFDMDFLTRVDAMINAREGEITVS
jgi:predicted aspartyl protease